MTAAVMDMLTVACESTQTELSKPTLKLWHSELTAYPEPHVLGALRKCCKEIRGRLTLADVISRLDDGRPAVEAAWAMIATVMNNEQASIVWTEEMREAYGVVAPLADDPIAARMAFKERYTALLAEARDKREPVKWSASLGYDKNQREEALLDAVRKNQLSLEHVNRIHTSIQLPGPETQKLITQVDNGLPSMPEAD